MSIVIASRPLAPPPQEVTALQFILAAAREEWITDAEAEAWAAERALPALVTDAIAALPQAVQFDARVRARSMTAIRIDDPILSLIMPVVEATEADRDDLFRLAATL
jgi:hypothetical protein